jgi:transmembrane sensor
MRARRHRLAEPAMPQQPTYNANARQQAAGWVVRLDAGSLSDAERVSLQAWLDGDPAHAEALERAQATWRELDMVGAPRAAAGPRPRAAHAGPRGQQQKRRYRPALTAACVAALLIALGVWQYPRADIALRADARTATGETQSLALAGGSAAQLDTGSALRIRDDAAWRDVQVLTGTVSFNVGHDDPRPFRVRAGQVVVTDIGTTFQLKRDGTTTQVVVASGLVELAAPGGKAIVHAGESATLADDDRIPTVAAVDADAAMAWTRGRLVFVDRPLSEVVAELNRYYSGRIVLLGDGAGSRRVSGVFRTSDPLAALRVIEANLGLRATHLGLGLVVLRS